MPDKRFLKRNKSLFYLKVEDYVTGREVGRLVDISDHGFKLISDEPVATESERVFTIELPEPFEGKEQMMVTAKGLYNKRDVNPDYFSAGFRFIDLSRYNQKVIVWLSKDFIFQD